MAATDISGVKKITIPIARRLERLPWPVRALFGALFALVAVAITYVIPPLRTFPLLVGIPTVIIACWYLGTWGGFFCALSESILVEVFVTSSPAQFLLGPLGQQLRMPLFVVISISIGWVLRKLADQRAELDQQELQQKLLLADAERRLAEERALATEALRERDEMLGVALQANGTGLWVWDVQNGRVYWSDEMYRLGGHEPGSVEPTFEAWLELVAEEDRPRLEEARKLSYDTGEDYRAIYRVRWRDKSIHWMESQAKCLLDSDGKVIRVVGVMADITQRKHAEEAMLRAEKLAVAGKLAASVAHEINNPLEAVSNLLFLITLTDSSEQVKQHAQTALEQLMRVSMITQQTLKFHRQSGYPSTTRLSETVDTVRALFNPRLVANDVTVEIQVTDEEEVNCMPSEAQQIFANLLANAIEATPKGGRVTVRLKTSHDWRDRTIRGMRVTFADSGTGVDRETIKRMFEPFFTTKAETGTGLGLWVVAQLIERHNGHICVYSRQRCGPSGTVFSVFIPFNHENAAMKLGGFPMSAVPELGVRT
jgi:PAS domain S-box-containing protein